MKLITRIITQAEAHNSPFELFQGWEFDKEYEHVLFALEVDGKEVVWAYAWNLDTLADADKNDYAEIVLMEALVQREGLGTTLINMLKDRYAKLGVHNAEAENFWTKNGFSGREEGYSGPVWTWKRKQYGGPRPGAGRKHLNGSKPGEGEYATRTSITLSQSLIDYLKSLSVTGNLSEGVRIVAQYHMDHEG